MIEEINQTAKVIKSF